MHINGDSQRPIDPAARKRQAEAAGRDSVRAGAPPPATGDQADVGATPTEIVRYVQILKAMNPIDLHRVEDLRARIKNGSYTATPDQLAGPLSDLLDQGRGGDAKPD